MRKILVLMLALIMALSCMTAMAEETEGGWKNILLLGGDARDMTTYGLTDCMMILSINREEALVKMTSIMRDTWVKIPGKGNQKINAAQNYGGPELAMQTVNENFGTDIEDYVMVNMEDLAQIVDLFGGVMVDVSENERKVANQYISDYFRDSTNVAPYVGETSINATGLVRLNGIQAMSYCRDRYTGSDFDRVMRQQEVLKAMASEAQNMEVDVLMDIAGQVSDIVSTNMEKEELKDLATSMMVMEMEDVQQYRIPADGAFKSGTFDGTWMIKADLAKNQELLKQFIYG